METYKSEMRDLWIDWPKEMLASTNWFGKCMLLSVSLYFIICAIGISVVRLGVKRERWV